MLGVFIIRDENRIDAFLKEFGELWHQYPDWCSRQLVICAIGENLYFVEDDQALQRITIAAKSGK